jgi:hypothetical protein
MRDADEPLFSFDASTFIELQRQPRRAYGTLWRHLDDLADAGRMLVAEEVKRELGDDPSEDPVKFIRDHPAIVTSTEDLWERAKVVANKYRDLVDFAKPKGTADPFVIALALETRDRQTGQLWGRATIVVSQENRKRPSKVAIPDACDDYGIRCEKHLEFFDIVGWTDL